MVLNFCPGEEYPEVQIIREHISEVPGDRLVLPSTHQGHPLPWDNKGAKQFILRMFLKDELGYWTWATVLALLFKSEKKKTLF